MVTRLIDASDEDFAALIAGPPPRGLTLPEGGVEAAEVLSMLRVLASNVRAVIDPAAWLIVEDDEIVGLCSIMKPPSTEGVIEIGYGIAATRRGRGAATRAVAGVLNWARAQRRITAVTADTAVANRSSQAVLERNGFARVGWRADPEDGDMVCWRIAVDGRL